jgi:hypothetical protein
MQLAKIEAAARQLDTAIQLFFEGRDAVAVCTLAAAAGRVLSDLVEHEAPKESFRSVIVAALPHIPRREIYFTLDRTPNFLKHADHDPEAIESFNEAENEHRLFVASDEYSLLGYAQSIEMQVLQIWYVASYPDRIEEENDPELFEAARHFLPGIHSIERETRVSIGAALLSEQKRLAQSEIVL